MALIELEGVEKYYGQVHALRNINLTLEPGRIGLLGPNGAGKSTLLKALLGLIPIDAGSRKVLGYDVTRQAFDVRARLGFMPEGDSVIGDLTALEFAVLAAELTGLPHSEAIGRAHQVLYYVGLGEARYRRVGSFSTGMRQRARLAQALVGDPKLLLLDEPTSGLDPEARDEVLSLVADIPARTGASVILSTHILPDVERTCDQVIVIAGGGVLYAGALGPLIAADVGAFELRAKGDPAAIRSAVEQAGYTATVRRDRIELRTPAGTTVEQIFRLVTSAGFQVRHIAPFQKTLEQAFFQTLAKQSGVAVEGSASPFRGAAGDQSGAQN